MSQTYGLLAAFEDAQQLLAAARQARQHGYRALEAYSPFHVEGLTEVLEMGIDWVPFFALFGGIVGLVFMFMIQWYSDVIGFPHDIGGRPDFSWPLYVPTTVEMMILGAALFAFGGMMLLNGLPRPHHPVFGVSLFAQASSDRFFLVIKAEDPRFEVQAVERFLQELHPLHIEEVPA